MRDGGCSAESWCRCCLTCVDPLCESVWQARTNISDSRPNRLDRLRQCRRREPSASSIGIPPRTLRGMCDARRCQISPCLACAAREAPEITQGLAWSRRTWIARSAFAIEELARCHETALRRWCVASPPAASLPGPAWRGGRDGLLRTAAATHSWFKPCSYCTIVYRLA